MYAARRRLNEETLKTRTTPCFSDVLLSRKFDQKLLLTTCLPTTTTKFNNYRGVAQLVARDIWDVEAAGSNPVTPTKTDESEPKKFGLVF